MQVRRSTIPLLAFCAVAAVLLAVSTGAVVLDEPADQLNDEVALQPGDNPYTYLDDDDDLTIDVTEDNPRIEGDGVNPNAFTTQSALFYITYDGNASAEAWIEHDAEAVAFVVDGDPVESEETAVRMGPDRRSVPVGVEVDTRIVDAVPGDRLIDEITVHAQPVEPDSPADDGEE